MLNDELTTFLKSHGADLIGFADLREIPPDVRDNFHLGLSIAVALKPRIISGIEDGPNLPYFEEYKRANHLLDTLGNRAARFLEQRGYKASSFAVTNAGIDPQTFSTRLPPRPWPPAPVWAGLANVPCWLPGSSAPLSGLPPF